MHSRGFTLVEMLAVITISAILVALALPSFRSIVRSSQISSTSNDLLASIDLARSEAIRRNVTVSVCRSLNPENVAPVCSSAAANGYAANDWSSGWITFAKAAANINNALVEAGDEIIARRPPPAGPTPERLIVESTLPNPQQLAYFSNGLANGGNLGTFFIDYRDVQVAVRSVQARCLAINFTGRARVAVVVNDACPAA
ncbi:MAG TPA: GspH/FimT family pseudopilin [Burkholderiaceae bacterium]|nr:GspH/FimT family pseudopilin [Burkholderiaceae bacterium]